MTNQGSGSVSLSRTPPVEPGTVAYPHATWTSFDRYDRYVEIARIVRTSLGPGDHRVLDVGDTAGYLHLLEPDLWVIGLDIELTPERLEGNRPLLGDGSRLPFADDTFDAIVSSDVLEHVLPERRDAFLAELRRVSRELVVVAAPFDTPGVAGAEDLVRRYAALALGEPQPQLEEHRERGPPTLQVSFDGLLAAGGEGAVIGNGNLWDWLVSMLLRFQIEARPALDPLSQGFDVFHNTALASMPAAPPYYRHLLVSWVDRAPELTPVTDESPAFPTGTGAPASVDLVSLASVLVAADTSEAVRQDVHGIVTHQVLPPIAEVDAGIVALHERIGGMTDLLIDVAGRIDRLAIAVDQLTEQTAGQAAGLAELQSDTRSRLEELFVYQVQVNAPLLRAKGVLAKVRNRLRSLTR